MRMGVVYPANTAAVGVGAVMEALSDGELDTADIPYYYRWALFDSGGQAVDPGNMDERHLGYAQAALDGETVHPGFFYSQYHQLVQLPDGTTCVLQYDYSMPYGAEVLQRRLPEFQSCATIVLLLSWLAAGAVSTPALRGPPPPGRRPPRRRRGDHRPAAAGRAPARQGPGAGVRGDPGGHGPAPGGPGPVLESQWAMERQRDLELAALTHDLKTAPHRHQRQRGAAGGGPAHPAPAGDGRRHPPQRPPGSRTMWPSCGP